MIEKNKDLSQTLYNPFDDYNANQLDPDTIMQYWCSPFGAGALQNYQESYFFRQKNPIIIQGSRGTGKTTLLKYLSLPLQKLRAEKAQITILQQVCKDGGIGFYKRLEQSQINAFGMIFSRMSETVFEQCFEHYLELFFVSNILGFLHDSSPIIGKEKINDMITNVVRHADLNNITTLEDLSNYIEMVQQEFGRYKNEVLFIDAVYKPIRHFPIFELSNLLVDTIISSLPECQDILFLLLIDEFENLQEPLQRVINKIVKFCPAHISLRIGRRSEKYVSTATIDQDEYLRENHDFSLVKLDYTQEMKTIEPYLLEIAKKRLSLYPSQSKIPSDLSKILGRQENLLEESNGIANDGSHKHLEYILKSNKDIRQDQNLMKKIIKTIHIEDNAIAEAICALWVIRSNGAYLDKAQEAYAAAQAFLRHEQHPLVHKFKNDYSDKYRYALTTVIAVAYKRNKLYYSFNTLCYISEGNPRVFINLCSRMLTDAIFYENEKFTSTGKISSTIQDKAIREYAATEFRSIWQIIEKGDDIERIVQSIENDCMNYHKDREVRYPETCQFVFVDNFSADIQGIIDTALSWSIILKRPNVQRETAGTNRVSDIYRINRIFCPLFNISYRTRGGVNLRYTEQDIRQMVSKKYAGKQLYFEDRETKGKSVRKNSTTRDERFGSKDEKNYTQLSFFSNED